MNGAEDSQSQSEHYSQSFFLKASNNFNIKRLYFMKENVILIFPKHYTGYKSSKKCKQEHKVIFLTNT